MSVQAQYFFVWALDFNITATIAWTAYLGAMCVFEQVIRDALGFALALLGAKLMLSLVVQHQMSHLLGCHFRITLYRPLYTEFTLELENWAQHSSCTQLHCWLSGCTPSRASHPSQSHSSLFALLSDLSQPPDNCLLGLSLKGSSSVIPSVFISLCRKLSARACSTQCG